MPETISRTSQGQIIGGTFTSSDNADKAVRAFQELGISPNDIEVVVQLNETKDTDKMWADRGFAESQADYYEQAIRDGKILVVVYGVVDPAPVIDVFDQYRAEFNPNGSRNLRDDVAGMTVGAAVGAVAGGVAGAAVAGPPGAVAGAAAGAVVGGGAGAAAGKAAEHRK